MSYPPGPPPPPPSSAPQPPIQPGSLPPSSYSPPGRGSSTQLVDIKTGPSLPVRAIWYLLVGWWATAIAMAVAWFAALTLIGLPLTFWIVNRIPTLLTLRPRREQYVLSTGPDGVTRYERLSTEQHPWYVRVIYFVLVGWWASALWMFGSYLLMLTLIGIPLGLMMVNRLPFVFSLHQGYA